MFPSTPSSTEWTLPFRFYDRNFVCISHASNVCNMTINLSLLYLITLPKLGVCVELYLHYPTSLHGVVLINHRIRLHGFFYWVTFVIFLSYVISQYLTSSVDTAPSNNRRSKVSEPPFCGVLSYIGEPAVSVVLLPGAECGRCPWVSLVMGLRSAPCVCRLSLERLLEVLLGATVHQTIWRNESDVSRK
jgi:hypothetical protein